MANKLSSFNNCTTIFPTKTRSKLNRVQFGPKIVSMAQNQYYWASIDTEIQTYLRQAIPVREPLSVFEPMHYLTFAAPTTPAPALCVAACELVGGDRNQALAAAAAVHLIHVAAYTHENLPLTDRVKPKPEVEHKFGPNIELLTGDGVIPFGLELLARSMDPAQSNSDKILRVIVEITRAIGSQGIVEGQFRELNMEGDLGSIEYVSKKKEGELHACGAACGAIMGGGNEEEIEKLRNFGLYVGMIQGFLGKGKMGILEDKIENLKDLALKELEGFQGKKIDDISGLVQLQLSNSL